MQASSPLDALSEILMDVPDLVFTYATNGRYLFVNRSAADFLGSEPIEVIGHTWQDLGYPAEIMEPIFAHVLHVAQTCLPARHRLTTSPAKGGRVLDMSFTALMCEDEVLGVLAIAHDISEFFES